MELRLKTFYLLAFFKLQFDPGLDTIARVLICLLQSEFHEVLVVCSRQIPTDEDDHVGQDLMTQKESLNGGRVLNSWIQQ